MRPTDLQDLQARSDKATGVPARSDILLRTQDFFHSRAPIPPTESPRYARSCTRRQTEPVEPAGPFSFRLLRGFRRESFHTLELIRQLDVSFSSARAQFRDSAAERAR